MVGLESNIKRLGETKYGNMPPFMFKQNKVIIWYSLTLSRKYLFVVANSAPTENENKLVTQSVWQLFYLLLWKS